MNGHVQFLQQATHEAQQAKAVAVNAGLRQELRGRGGSRDRWREGRWQKEGKRGRFGVWAKRWSFQSAIGKSQGNWLVAGGVSFVWMRAGWVSSHEKSLGWERGLSGVWRPKINQLERAAHV